MLALQWSPACHQVVLSIVRLFAFNESKRSTVILAFAVCTGIRGCTTQTLANFAGSEIVIYNYSDKASSTLVVAGQKQKWVNSWQLYLVGMQVKEKYVRWETNHHDSFNIPHFPWSLQRCDIAVTGSLVLAQEQMSKALCWCMQTSMTSTAMQDTLHQSTDY